MVANKKSFLVIISVLALVVGVMIPIAGGENQKLSRPTLVVNSTASIKGSKILLGEISKISYREAEFADVVNQLASIELGEAPVPMSSTNILGANILSAIEAAGIPRDSIGYSIPNTVSVERLGRQISKEEVISALRSEFSSNDVLDVQVRDISWNNNQVIPLGDAKVAVYRLGEPAGGKIPLRVEVSIDDASAARFLATAIVDDWREVPVLSRTLERGMLVKADDVQMVRLNLFKQPEDIIAKADSLIGRRAKSRISAGEIVRAAEVDIPPVIPKGAQVTIMYAKAGLIASATGQVLEDGFENGTVHVRNSKSQKVLKARVKNLEQVEVIAE